DQRRWWAGGRELAELRGFLDVDLGITPATNTLPIRRLGLAVGERRDIVAAWVRFPELAITPLAQRYTRLAPARFRYESHNGRFVADLDVDDLGLVRLYGNGWQCEAATD